MAADNKADITGLFSTSQDLAQQMLTSMSQSGTAAVAAFGEVTFDQPMMVFPSLSTPTGSPTPITAFVAPASHTPILPSELETPTLDGGNFGTAPTFSTSSPQYIAPPKPSSQSPHAPTGTAPNYTSPTIPTAPVLRMPTEIVVSTINMNPMPSTNIPLFTTKIVVEEVAAPTEVFAYIEQPYNDALLDELKIKLMRDLINGGYGIEVSDEEALWARARDRELRNNEAMIQDVSRQIAARGFSLPSGVMAAQIAAAQSTALEKTSSLSREIALKRADMYVENRKFTITEVREVEQMLVTYWGYMMERALNVAKATVELGIKVFDARVAYNNFKLEKFKAEASVYDMQLKAALAPLEVYKAEIEGKKVEASVQHARVEVYNAQVAGLNAAAGLYRSQVEVVKIQAELEQLKLEAYKKNVEIYALQVSARTAEFNAYEAEIRGAIAPIEAYKAQAAAFTATVGGFEATVHAATAKLEAEKIKSTVKIESYKARIEGYKASVNASAVFSTNAVTAYSAGLHANVANAELQQKYVVASYEAQRANAELMLASAKQQGDYVIAKSNALIAGAHALGSVNATLATAYGGVGQGAMAMSNGLLVNSAAA